MTLGEGAAIFILETLEAALERGHEPICELIGYGTTNDAFDPLRADVDGPTGAMSQALDDAALTSGDIDYLNAHGTATYTNDMIEAEAIGRVFGDHAPPDLVHQTDPWTCLGRKRWA